MYPRPKQLAISLYAMAAGYADSGSYLSAKVFTGHVTGNLILLAITTAEGSWRSAALHITSILFFTISTAFGFRLAKVPRSRVWLFCLQAALMCLFLIPLNPGVQPFQTAVLYSTCLGLQNGVVVSVLGIALHSTFLSGDVTSLVRSFSSTPAVSVDMNEILKRHLLASVVVSFVVGAVAAALVTRLPFRFDPLFILVPLSGAMLVQVQAEDEAPGPTSSSRASR